MNFFQFIFTGFTTLLLVFVGIQFYLKYTRRRCRSRRQLDGKVTIVTGANSGIGYETAKDFAKRGAKVILACRDTKSGEIAAETIRRETSNRNVIVMKLDLGSLASIRSFAKQIQQHESKLDILVNNAGLALLNKNVTEDGFEAHFGVNHLGTFLLSNLLLGLMIKSGSSRIINVSSMASGWVKSVDLTNLNSEKEYEKRIIYSKSKLYNIMFTVELNKRLREANLLHKVTVNAVHPGIIKTNLARYVKEISLYNFFIKIFEVFMMEPLEGAQTSIHAAVSEEMDGISGLYWANCKNAVMNPLAEDEELCKELWKISANFVKLQPNEYYLK